ADHRPSEFGCAADSFGPRRAVERAAGAGGHPRSTHGVRADDLPLSDRRRPVFPAHGAQSVQCGAHANSVVSEPFTYLADVGFAPVTPLGTTGPNSSGDRTWTVNSEVGRQQTEQEIGRAGAD